MKQIFKLILVIILAVVFQTCSEQEELRPEKVQFSCQLKFTGNAGGRASSLPDGSVLKISIETQSGSPVLTNHTVNLLSFGESFTSDPLELTPGTYKIVDFLIVHGTTVLYAVPHLGSPLASAVINPLDFEFTVTKNNISTIEMEVINLNGQSPEDFGYTSFNIGILNTFELSVFTEQNSEVNFTAADGYILEGMDTVHKFVINPTVNRVAFVSDDEKTYRIEVIKDGYSRYTREFIINDLTTELNNKPLKAILYPALTLRANPTYDANNTFRFHIRSDTGGEVTINWGDGTSGLHLLNDTFEEVHTYPAQGIYFISVTGDLENVEYFSSYYGDSRTYKINVEHLPALKDFRNGLTLGPKTINLSQNPLLQTVDITHTVVFERLYLPADHAINSITISGPNHLTTDAVDDIINNVYANSINKIITDGFFGIKQNWQDGNDNTMAGPPSEAALLKLKTLRDGFGWQIHPNP
jgi:hypothetical protein